MTRGVRRAVPADQYASPPAQQMKVAHAETLKVDQGAVGDHRARHLIHWYNEGANGEIPWGAPGDFAACVAVATEHAGDQMTPAEIKGFCANRHHDALGIWPATHAATERGHGV